MKDPDHNQLATGYNRAGGVQKDEREWGLRASPPVRGPSSPSRLPRPSFREGPGLGFAELARKLPPSSGIRIPSRLPSLVWGNLLFPYFFLCVWQRGGYLGERVHDRLKRPRWYDRLSRFRNVFFKFFLVFRRSSLFRRGRILLRVVVFNSILIPYLLRP